jgi:hypothetical protein
MKALKLIGHIVILLTLLLLHPSTTAACSPPLDGTPEPHEHLVERLHGEAHVIFVGSVIGKTEEIYKTDNFSSGIPRVYVSFAVADTLKGAPQATQVVTTGTGRGDCGVGDSLVMGETYLIYAEPYGGYDSWLTRVATASKMHEDIAILHELSHVDSKVGMPRTGESLQLPLLTFTLIAGLALSVGLIVRRKAWHSS